MAKAGGKQPLGRPSDSVPAAAAYVTAVRYGMVYNKLSPTPSSTTRVDAHAIIAHFVCDLAIAGRSICCLLNPCHGCTWLKQDL
jgi:hypothetical protein